MKILKIITILFCFLLQISCGPTKTGTIADINYSPNFFNFDTKIPVEDGKIVKFPIRTNERRINSIKEAESRYIKNGSAYFIQNSEFQKTGSVLKKSEITGREKMIDQFKIVQQGYILKYIFNVDKEIVSKIDKVTIELLNANKVLEVVAEYFPKTKLSIPEGSYAILSKGYFSGESKIIINKSDYIKGDRKYLYIFKITLESKDEKLDEVYGAFFSHFHDKNYKYVQGHI
ncbi:hypothetical protein DW261_07065 [Fusobacterium varium]|uniref:hypothetical protein n=1 Tax=Fusobacterium varium TaxID=856 RepID=UPI000E4728F0|nr:hypothetical protein [Fusobacterium varium]RHG35989.1 hypothetical protein DW261_07065 [Fusobacterium varium]